MAEVLRKHHGSVVAAWQHEAAQEVVDRDYLPFDQLCRGANNSSSLPAYREKSRFHVDAELVHKREHYIRGHHLGQAGHFPHLVRLLTEENLTVLAVEDRVAFTRVERLVVRTRTVLIVTERHLGQP